MSTPAAATPRTVGPIGHDDPVTTTATTTAERTAARGTPSQPATFQLLPALNTARPAFGRT